MALYRKYRPATFAEVVGQEQVTTPLSAALDAGRINHAYLFSGPRGCGKTSSARIMARSLNCVEGPTSTPCGVCASCISLAPGGPGNLDVTELDAASHNGVEDMRDLRDRAYFAPAESRYRIFIIDEAHMITDSGANALLKVVEEPPEHVIFIFATTEPEKIIGTIRSRTHHYPFRLLTPPAMKGLLQRTVASEGVAVEDAVYPMIIQAGGGSPRDTLSILDQLLAGAGPDGLTYDLARPLLGVTDVTLLDDAVSALATHDKAALFKLVDHVIEAGHEPRRFAIDLLDRLRDLMILQAVPGALEAGLVTAPTDRGEVLLAQAQRFSGPQLTYLASTVSEKISGLRGATSPRLLLEILCAHLLIGASAPQVTTGPTSTPAPVAAPHTMPAGTGASAGSSIGTDAAQAASPSATPAAGATAGAGDPAAAAAAIIANRRNRQAKQQAPAAAPAPEATAPASPAPESPSVPSRTPAAESPAPQERSVPAQEQPAPERTAPEPVDFVEQVRSQWPHIRSEVGRKNKIAEIMLTEARVLGFRDNTLVLGHTTGALAERINAEANNGAIVETLRQEFQRDVAVKCVIGTDPAAAGFSPQRSAPKPAWNPNSPHREASTASDQEAESPSPQPHKSASASVPASASAPEPAPEPRPQEKPQSEQQPQQQPQAEQAEPVAAADPWGAPRKLGGQESQEGQESPRAVATTGSEPSATASAGESRAQVQPAQQSAHAPAASPAPQPEPAAAPKQAQGQQDDAERSGWRSRIARATQVAKQRDEEFAKTPQFSNGVPLPPEPAPEEAEFNAPPDDYYPEDSGAPAPSAQPQSAGAGAPQRRQAAPAALAVQPVGQAQAAQPGQPVKPGRDAQHGHPAPAGQAAPARAYTQDDQEREMLEEARNAGERDRRSGLEVAMELLSRELGAKRL
ncbi:MAG: DNA polymerase III subunit gamma and tau [Corynebacterium flavescens]|uniref:DNA polymerase III subunit gamma and tau n=1 Tax=Corynebacterium flavescens TaxID=28028 RepID=UPI003F936423